MRSILVPVDVEDPSTSVLRMACELGRGLDGSLTLLYVYGVPSYAYAEGALPSLDLAARIATAARGALENVRAGLGDVHVPIALRVEPGGHPAEAIVKCAREGKFDLIVMPTSDRSALGRFFLGRVTDRVLRLAPCPVLTVRR